MEGGRVPIKNAAYSSRRMMMKYLRIRIEWNSGHGISAAKAAGELCKQYHGLPGLLSGGEGLAIQSLEFSDQYWSRAKTYIRKMQDWLREHDTDHSWVVINNQPLEGWLMGLLGRSRFNMQVAVHRIKSSRRFWPNEQAKYEREMMESLLAELDQVLD